MRLALRRFLRRAAGEQATQRPTSYTSSMSPPTHPLQSRYFEQRSRGRARGRGRNAQDGAEGRPARGLGLQRADRAALCERTPCRRADARAHRAARQSAQCARPQPVRHDPVAAERPARRRMALPARARARRRAGAVPREPGAQSHAAGPHRRSRDLLRACARTRARRLSHARALVEAARGAQRPRWSMGLAGAGQARRRQQRRRPAARQSPFANGQGRAKRWRSSTPRRHSTAMRGSNEVGCSIGSAATTKRGATWSRASDCWRPKPAGSTYNAQAVETFFARLKRFFVRANIALLPQRAAARRRAAADLHHGFSALGHDADRAGAREPLRGARRRRAVVRHRAAAVLAAAVRRTRAVSGKPGAHLDSGQPLGRHAVPRLLLRARRAVRAARARQALLHRQDAVQRDLAAAACAWRSRTRRSCACCAIRWTCACPCSPTT